MKSSTTEDFVRTGPQVAQTDDVAALQQYLHNASFAYVDVAAEQALLAALRRWPLLLEISAWLNEPPSGHYPAGPWAGSAGTQK
ncbi:hypothetical protein CR159_18425 [Pollutimonas subterranea]|uniref:Cellulose biosynthesis protein BcsR n=1 Tax=Pollutimonas subterranea TaxID=2045210 RepID=A0A2N4U043_9BURK|nr:cellulose biosynthesis protein BcsR [Pollutimonas subterranea]PLC48381.1 hypothetical protein CR159_18425 [Pollutimonas subterranea]